MKKLTSGDTNFHGLVTQALANDPNAGHFQQEYQNMQDAKDPQDWFNNHPVVQLASAFGQPDTSFSSVSKNVMSTLKGSVQAPQGATNALINKLSLNKNFVRMFSVNPSFQDASLQALGKYNQGIKPGTTNESEQQQL